MARITLPHENPAWIYEDLEPGQYEKATGRVFNRAPKQIQENVEHLATKLGEVLSFNDGVNLSGDGSIQSNRNNIYIVPNKHPRGYELPLPAGMTVDERLHEIVITDVDTQKHYYKPEHFTIKDSKTLITKTEFLKDQKLLFRIWVKSNKTESYLPNAKVLANTLIPIPPTLSYIPTVNRLVIALDGVIQKNVRVVDGGIQFLFDVHAAQEILFISL